MEQTNELVKEIIKETLGDYLSEHTIKNVLKEVVKEFVRENFSYYFQHETNKYINDLINKEVKNVLNGEINIDNGWDKKEHYDSFEQFFKAEFKKRMDSTWEMKHTIEKTVQDELKKLFDNKIKEITPKIHNMVLDEILNSK